MIQVGANVYAEKFYLFSVERSASDCWWKAGGRGYTSRIDEAGLFTLDEVNAVLRSLRGTDAGDIPVPSTLVDIFRALLRDMTRS